MPDATTSPPVPQPTRGRPPRRGRLVVAAAGALAGVALIAGCRPPLAELPPASVVFVLVDTLRADHLGTYGYPRPTSPRIDRLAAESVVFTQARTVSPWTNPTIVSLFTGRHPTAVQVPQLHAEAIRAPLPAGLSTLAERLRGAGLRTLAFVDHPGISPGLGFARGFETFVRLYQRFEVPAWGRTEGGQIVAEIARQLRALGEARCFVYLHLVYPHRPYDAPAEYDQLFGPTADEYRRRNRDGLRNAYDAEIRYTDNVVGELLATLDRAGRLDDTWVVITSDHGEGFWEHGYAEHGNSFYDELLRVPLIVRPPRAAGVTPRRVDDPVSLVDLHATVLEMAGAPATNGHAGEEGRSLLRFLGSRAERGATPLVSQQPHSGDVRGAALVTPPWKLIRRAEPHRGTLQLYDLVNDPRERENLAAAQPDLVRRLDAELAQHLLADQARRDALRSPAGGEVELDADEIERLRALGYLN